MTNLDHSLTQGYVHRHVPQDSQVDIDIALLDIAQDFILSHLHDAGYFNGLVVFKGGTALRKLFAGMEGRFSTDLDFALFDRTEDPDEIGNVIADDLDTSLGPFDLTPKKQRGRWSISVSSEFGDPGVSIKLDVGPPCWLEPEEQSYETIPIHERYGWSLPDIPCMRLEELISEKIARLNRSATARDAWDLVWIATTSPYSNFDRDLVREITALKIWVDNNGMGPSWDPSISPRPFHPDRWLSAQEDWDKQKIGLLTQEPPPIDQLEEDLFQYYSWLEELTSDQETFADANEGDRSKVLKAITTLQFGRLNQGEIW
ncbi:MAG: nucleotidyl transferase AbiEii/AbiGii toxin family protein [bacterium]